LVFFGFFDIASKIGLPKHEEDFGQTLAVWGVPQGSYLVLPILGPTTFRGVPGGVFDIAANPTSYVGMPAQLVSMLNTRASADGALKFINDAAIDPYVFTREAFLQNQQHLISDGKVSTNVDVMPLEDDLFNDTDNDSKDNQVQAAINTKTATIPSVDTETNKAEKDSPPLSLSATTLDRSTTTASVDTSVIQPTKGKVKHLHHSKKSEAIKAEKSKSTKQD
jgi:phospholipid-binding lipoprotein MlaA